MTARGVRNNNPGNIRISPTAWRGKIRGDDKEFETFEHPVYGIRAMARILMGYQYRHGLNTIYQMIRRWAPAEDNNDVGAYATAVARGCGVTPDTEYPLDNDKSFGLLIYNMIRVEVGSTPYSFATIYDGIALAKRKEV